MVAIDDAKSVSLSVGGKSLDVCYYEEGSGDQGSVIFMQTGGAGTTAYMCWHRNIDAFVDAGIPRIRPRRPGFGRFKLAAGVTGPVDGGSFLLAFMDALGVMSAPLAQEHHRSSRDTRFG